MNSIKCPDCGLVNFVDAPVCLRCKRTLGQGDSHNEPLAEASYVTTDKLARLKSLMRPRLVASVVGIVVVGALLNQTYIVSSWFVQKEIAEVIRNLDERTKTESSDKLLEARDRVKTLAIHASRGRQSAIRELVDLDVALAGIRVPNPATRKAEERENVVAGLRQLSGVDRLNYSSPDASGKFAYDPAMTGSYLNREASIGEFVGEILVHVGESSVEPITERIKTIHSLEQAGDKTMAAEMPRELLIALGRLKSPRAFELLITCAQSKPYSYNNVKVMEALSFYETSDPRLLEIYDIALTEARTPNDPDKTFTGQYVIRVASDGLAKINSEASLQILISHLDLGNWEYQPSHVAKAITRFGKPAVPSLLALIGDSSGSEKARQNAIQVLGLLRASEVKSDVIALLDSPQFHGPAAQALGEWGKVESIPDLEAAKQRHPEWTLDFNNALQRIQR